MEEILSDKRTRTSTAAEDTNEIMERAPTGLQIIVKAIEEHPGAGQTRRLVRFLAGVYNGSEFPFDLTDLRVLDTELANACIDYLNYDRLSKAEVQYPFARRRPADAVVPGATPDTPAAAFVGL